jgi:hypothetical protein
VTNLIRLAALAVALVGCHLEIDEGRLIPPPERSAEAIATIMETYGAPHLGVPTIYWYGPSADPACPGFKRDGECDDGDTQNHLAWFADDEMIVVVMGPLSESSLAHELAHYRFVVDSGHPATYFGDYDRTGVDGGIVGKANAALAAAGM